MEQEPVLELNDIQGNIVPGFKKDSQHFVLLRVIDAQLARNWLRGLAPRLSSAREVRDAHTVWKGMRRKLGRDPDNLDFLFVNCAISAAGLRKLGLPGIDEFDDAAFKLGLESRASVIGDPPNGSGTPGAPETWLFGSGRRRPDVLVILAADDDAWTAKEERELVASARSSGFQRVHVDRGRVRPGVMAGHEHFGFKDGISLPAIRGRASAAADDFVEARLWPPGPEFDPYRPRYAAPGRQLVWPGHFLFGCPRQMRDQPEEMRPNSEPPGPTWAKNGSFLVYRRLKQNVSAFQQFLAAASATLRNRGFDPNLTPERLGALLVGRWASGWPVARDPHTDRGPNQPGENHFRFSEATNVLLPNDLHPLNSADPNGMVCPFAAHIRKVQPRDDSTDIGPMERTFQKLIIRRGITFGPELSHSHEDRGLLFVAYQTSIVDQFEFLMNDWVNDANKPHANGGVDPIIGGARDHTLILNNGNTTFPLTVPGGWVVATGGEYMFAPSLSFFSSVL
ncbi:MAG: Dyp-type peroxidase [Deltaproteobacteria bacterium]|nr:Dyp-type peroxidase [Deltaproteobacteria bacterium]